MDRSQKNRQAVDGPPDSDQDDETRIRRMLRLCEDLDGLAGEIHPDDAVCLQIVQTPQKLYVSGGGNTPDLTPVLAAVLRASLERQIAIAGQV